MAYHKCNEKDINHGVGNCATPPTKINKFFQG